MWKRVLILTALIALVVPAGTVIGGRPVKPPPLTLDGGLIYFVADGVVHHMDPDGSDVTSVPNAPVGPPSMTRHYCPRHEKDERLFLEVRALGSGVYGNGVGRHELYAVCESGTAFQLTNAPSVEPDNTCAEVGGTPTLHAYPRWFAGDERVSYTAMRWADPDGDGIEEVVEWGFYSLEIDPDRLDLHTACAPTHIDVDVTRKQSDHWSGGWVSVAPSWSPDGTAFTYKLVDLDLGEHEIRRADLESGIWSTEKLLSQAGGLVWSPVGDRVLFKLDGNFISMDPYDTTDQVNIAAADPRQCYGPALGAVSWSPSGTHFAYAMTWLPTKKLTLDRKTGIFRDRADRGGDWVELTAGLEDWVTSPSWVADE